MKERTEAISFRLSERQIQKLKLFAKELGLQTADIVRNMIDNAEIASRPVIATTAKKEGGAPADQATCATFA